MCLHLVHDNILATVQIPALFHGRGYVTVFGSLHAPVVVWIRCDVFE